MKWLGQYIQDLPSRFRDDVYLEDISTGTIASGGNLGLDSNNKIVKATEATGDITSITFQTDSGAGGVGTVASGDASFRLLGSSGVGVTNSTTSMTAVAVPGEIDHDSLLNFASNEHFTQANITTVGTIDTGVWNGTAIGASYVATLNQDTTGEAGTVATIAGLAPNTATTQATQAAITTCANLVTVGTIDTGVWEGSAIETDQQNHLMHYTFSGYTEGNGSTYEIPVVAHDPQAPFEHNTSTGADGLDAITVQNQVRTNGKVMPRGGTLKKWTGWATGENTSGTTNIALFKVTPANDSTSTVSPVLLKEIAFSAGGNSRSFAIAETSFSVDVAAGDVVFTGIKGVNNKDVYFTSTLEVEF